MHGGGRAPDPQRTAALPLWQRFVAESLIDLPKDQPRGDHRDDEQDDIDEMPELNMVPENDIDDFEDDELAHEENPEERNCAEHPSRRSLALIEVGLDPVLDTTDHVEHRLE